MSFYIAINAYYCQSGMDILIAYHWTLQNPAIADVYTEHSCPVNVAKYSPSGFYIASGGM